MMTLKEIFGKTSTIGPMEVNWTSKRIITDVRIPWSKKRPQNLNTFDLVHSPQNFRIVVKQLAHNENGYRDVLKEIFMSESNLIVLDCEKKILEEVLKQCQQVFSFWLISEQMMRCPCIDWSMITLGEILINIDGYGAFKEILIRMCSVGYHLFSHIFQPSCLYSELGNLNLRSATDKDILDVSIKSISRNKYWEEKSLGSRPNLTQGDWPALFAGGSDQSGIFLLLDQPGCSHWYVPSS